MTVRVADGAERVSPEHEGASVTRYLAELARSVTSRDIPEDVVRREKFFVLDWLGVTLLGFRTPQAEMVRQIADPRPDSGEATVFGGSFGRTSLMSAALANGTAAHALDFDDGSGTGGLPHAAVTIATTTMALAEQRDATGQDLIEAILAGQEVGVRITRIMEPEHYARGFHKMATTGTFAATAAGAHLLGLDLDRCLMAFGIAGSQASGLRANFGTMTKPLHAGHTASSAVLSCLLAEKGFTATPNILETKFGYARAYAPTPHFEQAFRPLGRPYVVEGTRFKYHAACSGTHSTIDAIRRLRRTEQLDAADLECATIYTHPLREKDLNTQTPATALEAKFSLPYAVAIALHGWDTTESGFTDDLANDPGLRAIMARVTVDTLPDATTRDDTQIDLRMRDGRRFVRRHRFADHRLDLDEEWDALVEKFMRVTAGTLRPDGATQIVEMVEALDRTPSMRAFVQRIVDFATRG